LHRVLRLPRRRAPGGGGRGGCDARWVLSAIYTFYDPDDEARSLGRYAVLWQIQRCAEQGLPYVYLGYWIRNCRKMAYKADYRPLETLVNNQWQRSTEGLIESY
jgi:arginyl-tRNA--protein-N-Asp/Glu arginylyltransferase